MHYSSTTLKKDIKRKMEMTVMAKTLVLYYSCEDHTKKVAEVIAKELSVDIGGVKTIKEMTEK